MKFLSSDIQRTSDGVSAFRVGKTVDVDFGSVGAYAQDFSISDAAALTTSIVIAVPSAAAPPGGHADELDMDPITVQGRVDVAGTVIIKVVSSLGGRLRGNRRINYVLL